jgi:hypothetical protein
MTQPTFGDLVRIDGYGSRVFQVEAYRIEEHHYPDEQWTDHVYDLFDVGNADWLEADAEDLTLICDASQADEYLRANPAPVERSIFDISDLIIGRREGNEMANKANEPRKPTARELSGQEAERRKQARKERAKKIDALLDEMNDYKRLAEQFGDREYGERVAEIERELAELVAAGDRR